MDFWREVQSLVGRNLQTLDQGKPFEVILVKDGVVIVRVGSSGKERKIRRKQIEPAWNELIRRSVLARTTIRDQYSKFNPAYIAAILAALPGIEYTQKPIILRLAK
jgi:hypothetical protein